MRKSHLNLLLRWANNFELNIIWSKCFLHTGIHAYLWCLIDDETYLQIYTTNILTQYYQLYTIIDTEKSCTYTSLHYKSLYKRFFLCAHLIPMCGNNALKYVSNFPFKKSKVKLKLTGKFNLKYIPVKFDCPPKGFVPNLLHKLKLHFSVMVNFPWNSCVIKYA